MLKLLDRFLTIGLVDSDRTAGAHSIGVKKYHDISNDFLLLPRFLDQATSAWTDSLYRLKPGRSVFDDVKNLVTKLGHKLLGIDWTNAFDHPAGKIFLNTLDIGGWHADQPISLEL